MENEVRRFEKECDKKRIGFLVSNVYFSNKAIEIVENNDRIYLCCENDIVDVIKKVEKHKCYSIKNRMEDIEHLEFINETQKELISRQDCINGLQKELIERQVLLIAKLKE
ncbi:13561_t:CDS:1 [Cetraspora pellucida]|uniref:13561_t:CDS:1 n=1 Tax=Cetraspora pellucida TaxID=1433469 RepID=A0A9N9FXM7_9GLOM|nr:13561_t:CDS:1 [Cetraspora pellucida]